MQTRRQLVLMAGSLGIAAATCIRNGTATEDRIKVPLVPFQSDDNRLLDASGEKVRWATAIGREVQAEGIFVLAGKGYHDRLILDNTSICLRWKEGAMLPEAGVLVSVSGQWSSIEYGATDNASRSSQGAPRVRAYAVDVTTVKLVKRVTTLVVRERE